MQLMPRVGPAHPNKVCSVAGIPLFPYQADLLLPHYITTLLKQKFIHCCKEKKIKKQTQLWATG